MPRPAVSCYTAYVISCQALPGKNNCVLVSRMCIYYPNGFFFFSLCSLSPSFVFVCLFFFTNACSIHSRCPLSRRACLRILRARVLLKRSRNPYIYSRIIIAARRSKKPFLSGRLSRMIHKTRGSRQFFGSFYTVLLLLHNTIGNCVRAHVSKKKNARTALLRVYVSLEFATRL